MDFDLKWVAEACGAKLTGDPDRRSKRIWTDTRTLEKDDLFLALSGVRYDAHDYLSQAYERGARAFVVSDASRVPAVLRKDVTVLEVGDTLAAYGEIARRHRLAFKIPLVVVTGSVGKTTVKELIAQLLSPRYQVLRNRGTENNLVGVPKTLLQMNSDHRAAVIEIGTNAPGEIERLTRLCMPQMAVLTAIGASHLEGLKDLEGVKAEKLKVLSHLERGGLLVLNGEDPMLRDARSGVHRIVRAGWSGSGCDFEASGLWCHEKGSTFQIGDKERYETPLIGRHLALDCVLALAAASCFELTQEDKQKALSTFRPVAGRMQYKECDGVRFIDDTYNCNPTSLRSALETLKGFKVRERKVVIVGDMYELGEKSEEYHRQAGGWISEGLFDLVITAGRASRWTAEEAVRSGLGEDRVHHTEDSESAAKLYKKLARPGDLVLVKGSRGMQMEKVLECFTNCSTR